MIMLPLLVRKIVSTTVKGYNSWERRDRGEIYDSESSLIFIVSEILKGTSKVKIIKRNCR